MSKQYRENFYRGNYVDVNKMSAKLNNLFAIHHTGMYFVYDKYISIDNNFPVNIKENTGKPTYGFLEVLAQESLVYQRFTLVGVPEFPQDDSALEEYIDSKDKEDEKGTTYFEAFGTASNYSEYNILNKYKTVIPIKDQFEKAIAENKRTWVFERAGHFDGTFVTFKDWELLWDRKDENMVHTHEFIKNHLIPKNITIPESTFKAYEAEGVLGKTGPAVEVEYPKSQGNLWFLDGGFDSIIPNPVTKVGGLERLSPQYRYLKENGINLIDDVYTDDNGILTTNSIYNDYATLDDMEKYFSCKKFNDSLNNIVSNVDNYGTIGKYVAFKQFETFENKMKIPDKEDSYYQKRSEFERKGMNESYWDFPSIRNKKNYMEEMENIKTIKNAFGNQPLEIGNYYELPTEFAFRYLGRIKSWSVLDFKDMYSPKYKEGSTSEYDLSDYEYHGQEKSENWFNNSYGKENFVNSIKSSKYINGYFVYSPTDSTVPIKLEKSDFDWKNQKFKEIDLSSYHVVLKVHTIPRRPYNNRPIYAAEKTFANEFYTLYGNTVNRQDFEKSFHWYTDKFSLSIWGETYSEPEKVIPYNIFGSAGYYQEYWNKFTDCERHMEILAYKDISQDTSLPEVSKYAYHLDRYENNINKTQRTNLVVSKKGSKDPEIVPTRDYAINPNYAYWYRLSQPIVYQVEMIVFNKEATATAHTNYHTYNEFLIAHCPDKSAYYTLNEKMYEKLNLNNLFGVGTGYFAQRTNHDFNREVSNPFGRNFFWHEINSSNNFDSKLNKYGETFINEITNYRVETIENEKYLVGVDDEIAGNYGSNEVYNHPFNVDNSSFGEYTDKYEGVRIIGYYNPDAMKYNNTYKARIWESKEILKKEISEFWLNKIISPSNIFRHIVYLGESTFGAVWEFDLVPEEELFKDINPKELIQAEKGNYIKIPVLATYGHDEGVLAMTDLFPKTEEEYNLKETLVSSLYRSVIPYSTLQGRFAFVPLDMNKYFYLKFNEFMPMDNESNGFAVNYVNDKKKIKTVYDTKSEETVAGKNGGQVKAKELNHDPAYSRKYYKVIKDGYLYLYRIYYVVPKITRLTLSEMGESREPMDLANMKEYESFVKYMGIHILYTALYCVDIFPIGNSSTYASYTLFSNQLMWVYKDLKKNDIIKYDLSRPHAVLYKKIKLDIKRYIPVSGGGKRSINTNGTSIKAKEYDDYDTTKF